MELHVRPGAAVGSRVVADAGDAVLVRCRVGEAVDRAGVVDDLVVGLRLAHLLGEGRQLLCRNEAVVSAVADKDARLEGGGVGGPFRAQAAVKTHHRGEGFPAPRQLQGHGAAEAVADGGDAVGVGAGVGAQHREPRLRAAARQVGIAAKRPGEAPRLLRIAGDDPLSIHVEGEGDVAERGQLLGAAARIGVVAPPFVDDQDAGSLALLGVVIGEVPLQDRLAVLVLDHLRGDPGPRGGGREQDEEGGAQDRGHGAHDSGMERILVRRPGGLARLEHGTAPDPTPAAGEILVAVEAAGVNFADCVVRMGLYSSAQEYVGWPITPGFEAAGRVAALGAGVAAPAPGTRVVAVTRFGGYASRLVVPAAQLFALPDDVDLNAAAGFPTVFLTAWYALFALARPRPGATMLVHSAAGGVGGALLQLARIAGVRAVGVVGAPHKIEAARALGAEEVIDKSREDWRRAARRCAADGYAAVFDANGHATLRGSYDLLAPTGRLVVYGFASMLARGAGRPNPLRLLWGWLRTPRFDPLAMTENNRSVLAFNLSYLFEERTLLEEGMGRLLGWLREGRIRLPEPACTPLARAADAHRDLQSGRTTGKLVLTMA